MTNTNILRQKIGESGLKIREIMKQTGIKSYFTLREKIENRREFTASEITKMCELLHLDYEDREAIFFAKDAELHSA